MPKQYVLKLTVEERAELQHMVRKGRVAGWKVQRAQALLQCDQGPDGPAWTDEQIAAAYGVTTRSLESWRKQAVARGPLSLLERKPRLTPAVTPKLDGEKQARLTALACSKPPDGHVRWSLRLLAERWVELEVVESVSYETVRRAMKKKRVEALAQDDVVHPPAAGCRLRLPEGAGAGGLQAALRPEAPGRRHG
jgi:transposase-like protein